MTDVFLYGPLTDAALRETLFGREVATTPADLPDHRLCALEDFPFVALISDPGTRAPGLLAQGLGPQDLERLAFYAGLPGHRQEILPVQAGSKTIPAQVWTREAAPEAPAAPWAADVWAATWQPITLATLKDVMASYGQQPAARVQARWPMALVRGASRLRAGMPPPATIRHAARPGDVQLAALRQPYANFFAVEEYDLSFRRFDDTPSPVVTRAVFLSGDAVTVLPYDPLRDRVLLVEQFRAGAFARGDGQPWQLEAIAGRIDPGETPEQAARREAVEEAGLDLGELLPVSAYYPSPGAKSEFLYSYVALTDLPDGAAGVFGLAEEAENIRGHLLDFDQMMALVASGEINNGPLILTVFWLQNHRTRLRAAALPG